jgi:phage tail protein X
MTRRQEQLRRWSAHAERAAADFAADGDFISALANRRLARDIAVSGVVLHTLQGVAAGVAIIFMSFVMILATAVFA